MSSIDPGHTALAGKPALLEAFRAAAQQAPQVHVTLDGDSFKVLAQGQMSGQDGSRSVAWVRGQPDTTAVFVQALGQSFGGGLSAAVARELGLEPAPGKPVASRRVTQALDIAETGRRALSGVDFLSALAHSAVAGGPAFKPVAAELSIDPARLDGPTRAGIDARLKEKFDEAAAQGGSPVPPEQAAAWLRAELAPFTKPAR